jgi:hypothetical protein
MIIITGTGRSGTSILVKILVEYGLPYPTQIWSEKYRAGMEIREIAHLSEMIFGNLGDKEGFFNPNTFIPLEKIKEFGKRFKTAILEIKRKTMWLKDPRFSKILELWALNEVVDHLVICYRDVELAAKSAFETGLAINLRKVTKVDEVYADFMFRLGYLFHIALKYNIPYTVIKCPDDFLEGLPKLVNVFNLNPQRLKKICNEIFIKEY